MDESEFQLEESQFDSSIMRSGIPKSIEKVVPLEEDSTDLVYRNVDVMSTSSVRYSSCDGDNSIKGYMNFPPTSVMFSSSTLKQSPSICVSSPLNSSPSGLVTGKYQLYLNESMHVATRRVEHFLTSKSITFTQRVEAATNCWDCYTISNSVQLVKFQLLAVPRGDGILVDFKRERGCCEAMQQTFSEFQKCSGGETCAPTAKKGGKFSMRPPPLPEDDEEVSSGCGALEQALGAMSKWIESNPCEALQALGQLYGNKCRHLLRSENILADVCNTIKKHGAENTDVVVLALALNCLRKILSIFRELNTPCALSDDLVSAVATGLSRASKGKDLTARRECGLTLEAINSVVTSDQKISNL